MPGNKKSKRKPAPKNIGTPARMVERMETGLAERRKRKAQVMARNHRLTNLPMGHPANAYVLDMTFSPLLKMFDDHEKTGSHLFGDDGIAVMWVEREQCFTPITEACIQLHEQFGFTGQRLSWGDVPPGLLAYGMKLATGVLLDAQDIADARATVAWMREKLSGITCYDWYFSMEAMDKLQQEQDRQEAA